MKKFFRFVLVRFGRGGSLHEGLSSQKVVPDTRHPMTQLLGMMKNPEVMQDPEVVGKVKKGDVTFVSNEGSIKTLQYKDGPDGFVKITFHNEGFSTH